VWSVAFETASTLRATVRNVFGVLGGVVSTATFDVEAADGKDKTLGDSGGVGCRRTEVTWTMVVVSPGGATPGAAAGDGSSSSPLLAPASGKMVVIKMAICGESSAMTKSSNNRNRLRGRASSSLAQTQVTLCHRPPSREFAWSANPCAS